MLALAIAAVTVLVVLAVFAVAAIFDRDRAVNAARAEHDDGE